MSMQQLDFMVSLIDRVSGPAKGMMTTMDSVTTNIQGGMRKIGYGTAGLVGAGMALDRLIAPAKEMRTALGTLESLGVEELALKNLRDTALNTGVEFGKNSVDIVNASYKLQSAIGNLKGDELSDLVNKSTLLATATKGGLESTNSFVGQMFNIHEKEADMIGKTAFMNKLISKTSKAVQLFNTDGDKMGEAMKNIGKQATAMKVPLSEQLAVMGFLQNTMIEGSRSGTAYTAFLANINKAETTLGMKFTDTAGAALPMLEIIGKLEAKFGDLSKAADQRLMQKAFGKRGQQLLSAMAGSLGTFEGHLTKIQNANGLDGVYTMAAAITDPWDQASQSISNTHTKFAEFVLKALLPVYTWVAKLGVQMGGWMDQFPTLTRYLGYTVLGITAVIATLSLFSIGMGIASFISGGFTVSMGLFNGVMSVAKFSLLSILPAIWGFTAALLANPLTWVVLGVVALGAALVGLVLYWDDITAAIGRFFDKISSLAGIKDLLAGLIPDFILELIGVNKTTGSSTEPPKPIAAPAALNSTAPKAGELGVINKISNASSANNSRQIGDVHVSNFGQAMSGQQLIDDLEFMGG